MEDSGVTFHRELELAEIKRERDDLEQRLDYRITLTIEYRNEIDNLQSRLEEAVDEIIATKEQLSGCDAERRVAIEALRDAVTERVFWKGAAERALRLWERTQDELEEAEDRLADLAYEKNTR